MAEAPSIAPGRNQGNVYNNPAPSIVWDPVAPPQIGDRVRVYAHVSGPYSAITLALDPAMSGWNELTALALFDNTGGASPSRRTRVYEKVVQADEPPLKFSLQTAVRFTWIYVTLNNADVDTVVSSVTGTSGSAGTLNPGVTTLEDNHLVLDVRFTSGSAETPGNHTPTLGWTASDELVDLGFAFEAVAVYARTQAAAGASGGFRVPYTAGGSSQHSILSAITAPIPSGGGGTAEPGLPVAEFSLTKTILRAGEEVVLNASPSSDDTPWPTSGPFQWGTVANPKWEVVEPDAPPLTFRPGPYGNVAVTTSFPIDPTVAYPRTVTIRMTVTDANGNTDSVEHAITGVSGTSGFRANAGVDQRIVVTGSPVTVTLSGTIDAVTTGRSTSPDASTVVGKQLHAVYAVPSDKLDRELDTNGSIRNAVANMQAFIRAETGRELRWSMTEADEVEVTFLRLPRTRAAYKTPTGGTTFGFLGADLIAAGFTNPDHSYVMWVEADDDTAGVLGRSFVGTTLGQTGLSVIYLNQNEGTPLAVGAASPLKTVAESAAYIADTAAVHEVFHALGAVHGSAPHYNAGHSNDGTTDIMGGNQAPRVIDVGRDDYYNHAGTWIDTADQPFWTTPIAPPAGPVAMAQPLTPTDVERGSDYVLSSAPTDATLTARTRKVRYYALPDNHELITNIVVDHPRRKNRAINSLAALTAADQTGWAPDWGVLKGMALLERERLRAGGPDDDLVATANSTIRTGCDYFKQSQGSTDGKGERGALWATLHGGCNTLALCYIRYASMLEESTRQALRDATVPHRDLMFNHGGGAFFDFGADVTANTPWNPWDSGRQWGDTENHKLSILSLGFLLAEMWGGRSVGTSAPDSFRRSGNTNMNVDVRIRRSEDTDDPDWKLSLWHYFRDALYRYDNNWDPNANTSAPEWVDHAGKDMPIVEKNSLGYLGIYLACYLAMQEVIGDAGVKAWCEAQIDRLLVQLSEYNSAGVLGGYKRRSYHGSHIYAGPYKSTLHVLLDAVPGIPTTGYFRSGFFRLLQGCLVAATYSPLSFLPIIELARQKRGGYQIAEGQRKEGAWVERDFSLGFLLNADSGGGLGEDSIGGGFYMSHAANLLGGLAAIPFHEAGPFNRPRRGRSSRGVVSKRCAMVRTDTGDSSQKQRTWASNGGDGEFVNDKWTDVDASGTGWLHFRAKSSQGRYVFLAVKQANGTRRELTGTEYPAGSYNERVRGRVWEWNQTDMPIIYEVGTDEEFWAGTDAATWDAFKRSISDSPVTVTASQVKYASRKLGVTLVFARTGSGHAVEPFGAVNWSDYNHSAHIQAMNIVTAPHESRSMRVTTGLGGYSTTWDWDPNNSNRVGIGELPTKVHSSSPAAIFAPDREPVFLAESVANQPGFGFTATWETDRFPLATYPVYPVYFLDDGTTRTGAPVAASLVPPA